MTTENKWEQKDELRDYVIKLKKKYPTHLRHVEPDMLFYAAFNQPKSKATAKIIPIKDCWSLFSIQCYILAVHNQSWMQLDEPTKYYVIFHELLHIPDFGFVQGEAEYKKLIDHDVQDFSLLLDKFGVYKENVKELVGNNLDVSVPEKAEEE